MPPKKQRKSALEELFEEDDGELQALQQQLPPVSIGQRVLQELQLYRSLPCIPFKENAALWWWKKRGTFPLLSGLAEGYLCVHCSGVLHAI